MKEHLYIYMMTAEDVFRRTSDAKMLEKEDIKRVYDVVNACCGYTVEQVEQALAEYWGK